MQRWGAFFEKSNNILFLLKKIESPAGKRVKSSGMCLSLVLRFFFQSLNALPASRNPGLFEKARRTPFPEAVRYQWS
jgi:hypothetical protein